MIKWISKAANPAVRVVANTAPVMPPAVPSGGGISAGRPYRIPKASAAGKRTFRLHKTAPQGCTPFKRNDFPADRCFQSGQPLFFPLPVPYRLLPTAAGFCKIELILFPFYMHFTQGGYRVCDWINF
jgi:hypothetical protein